MRILQLQHIISLVRLEIGKPLSVKQSMIPNDQENYTSMSRGFSFPQRCYPLDKLDLYLLDVPGPTACEMR